MLFALAGSLRAFLLPAVVLILTSGRSSRQSPDPGGWGPAGWMNRWMPGDFEIANWQFWILLFLIPATIASLIRYFTFRLRYEGTELVISSGILFRNERHVPYARIQNLDAVRNIVHRLLGVAEVRVETGGGQTPEATISVLHETVFDEMRRRVFAGRAGVDHSDAAAALADEAESGHASNERERDPGHRSAEREGDLARRSAAREGDRTLLYLPTRELLLNGLLENRGMVIVAAAYGVLWEAGLFRSVWEQLTSGAYAPGLLRDTIASAAAGRLPSLGRIVILLIGIAGLLLLVRLLSMVWSFLRLHEFRLTRVGEDLRTEYGLLTRVTTTIPLKRVQSLTVRESPLQRLAGRMSVRVETAGGHSAHHDRQQQNRPREWLAPIIRQSAVPALVSDVLPGFDLDGFEWQPLHSRAFRRAMKPALLLSLITAVPFLFWFGWTGLLVLFITVPWLITLAWTHVRRTQWGATAHALALRSGWLWRQVTVVPAAKIQVVGCIESPFDRRAGMAGVRVDTAGSASPTHRISIPYLARETAAALYERLAAQTAQTALRW